MANTERAFSAKILAKAVASEVARSAIGVIATATPSLDVQAFMAAVRQAVKVPYRLAVLGMRDGGSRQKHDDRTTTSSETVANKWRHDADAIAGTKLIVVAVGQVAKLRSLETSLTRISDSKLRAAVRDTAVEWNPVAPRRVLWETITSDYRHFPTVRLLEFGAAVAGIVERRNTADLLQYETDNLYRLGLFTQPTLLDSQAAAETRRLIANNLLLVSRFRSPTKEIKARVGRVAEGTETRLAEAAERLLRFMLNPGHATLAGIDFDDANGIASGRDSLAPIGGNDRGTRQKKDKLLGDEAAAEDLLTSGGKNLHSVNDHFGVTEDEGAGEEFELGGRKVVPESRPGQSQVSVLLQRFFDHHVFGAYVEASRSKDYVSALNALASEEVEKIVDFRPLDPDEPSFGALLDKVARRGLPQTCRDILDVWKQYVSARSRLLPHIDALVDHPLLAMAESKKLLTAADDLVKAYGLMASKVEAARKAIEETSPEAAKRLSSKFISLDVVFILLEGNAFVAIAGPTHPFHLWRWVEIVRLLGQERDQLASLDKKMIVGLAANPPITSPHLLLTAQIEGVASDTVFLSVGSVAALPLYSDPESRTAAREQSKGIAAVLEKLFASAPHARNGCEIVAIDPPSVADLAAVLERATHGDSDEKHIPLHLRVLRTRQAPASLNEEDSGMDNVVVDIRETGGSLQVESGILTKVDIERQLELRPAHLTIIFEPGDAQAFRVGIEGSPGLSPLVVPRSYKYDDIEDRFDVVITGSETPFGGYYDLFRQLQNLPTRNTIGRRSGASSWLPFLSRIGKHSIWFTIVDQGLEPTMRIAGALRLEKRFVGGRDLHTFTSHAARVERTLRNVIEAAGLVPEESFVRRSLALMRRLGGNTIPVATSTSLSGNPFPPQARGILGVLAVGAWHDITAPGALLLSLDSDAARTWILGYNPEDRRRGDLLCLRQTKGGIHLDVIEVKVREDSQSVYQVTDVKREKRVRGHAIDQIDNVIAVLKRILPLENLSRIDQARREILREQLYMGVATRDMDGTQRGRADRLLQEFFREGAASISGKLMIVNLETSAQRSFPTTPVVTGVSAAGHAVEVFTLVESDLPEGVQRESKARPDTPTPSRPKNVSKRAVAPSEGSSKSGSGARSKGKGAAPKVGETKAARGKNRSSVEPSAVVSAESPLSILIGEDPTGKQVKWSSEGNPNFGVLITGDSGMGKSQTIRVFIDSLRARKLPVLIFDFKNDYSASEFVKPLGLKVYDVVRNGLPFNPMSLMPDQSGDVQPIRQCHELAAIISRVEGFGEQQQNQFVEAQKRAYIKHGIDPRQRVPASSIKTEPVFDDVLAEMALIKSGPAKTTLFRLQKFSDLGLFPTTTPSLTFEELISDGAVLTLNDSANDQLMRILAEILIVKYHALLKRGDQPRELRRGLVFDEAWRIAKSERLVELAREGRAFGVSLIIGSQFPDDLPETLVGSLRTQIFLHNKSPEMRKSVARVLCSASSGSHPQRIIETLGALPPFHGYLTSEEHKPWMRVNILPHFQR
jgi:hypothetical protein